MPVDIALVWIGQSEGRSECYGSASVTTSRCIVTAGVTAVTADVANSDFKANNKLGDELGRIATVLFCTASALPARRF